MNAQMKPAPSLYEQGFRDGQAALRARLSAYLDRLEPRLIPTPAVPKAANDEAPLAPARRQSEATTAPTFASGKVNKAEEARRLVAAALAKLGPTAPGGLSAGDLKAETGLTYDRIVTACGHLSRAGKARWTYARGKSSKVLLPMTGAVDAPATFSENQKKVLTIMRMATIRQAKPEFDGEFSMMRSVLASASGVPTGSMGEVIDALVRKRALEIVKAGTPHSPTTFRLIGTPAVSTNDIPRLQDAMATMEKASDIRFDRLAAPIETAPPPLAPPIPDYVPVPVAKPATVIPIRTKVNRPLEAPSADDLSTEIAGAAPQSLNARKPGECAWPINSPAPGRGEETRFCCAAVMGRLRYCEDHARLMWQPKPRKGGAA